MMLRDDQHECGDLFGCKESLQLIDCFLTFLELCVHVRLGFDDFAYDATEWNVNNMLKRHPYSFMLL